MKNHIQGSYSPEVKKKKKEKESSCKPEERSPRLGSSPSFAMDWTSHFLGLSSCKCKIKGLSGGDAGKQCQGPRLASA